jgi:hypothetical protein
MDRRLETEMMEFLYNAFETARERRAARSRPERASRWTWASLVRGIRARFELVQQGERQRQDGC